MPTHDCSKCEATEECPIKSIAPWLNEHEQETTRATKDEAEGLARACAVIGKGIPLASAFIDIIITAIGMAFDLGYHKGRQYPTVPKVYEEA